MAQSVAFRRDREEGSIDDELDCGKRRVVRTAVVIVRDALFEEIFTTGGANKIA